MPNRGRGQLAINLNNLVIGELFSWGLGGFGGMGAKVVCWYMPLKVLNGISLRP